ncbi:hypothetical protein [Adhaeribacter radiodurans]|uniref:Lipocalin family protein n=1 Tax=Adhaeribacter radiodurans TaxID=2745197 RepID=A0A7L7L5G9_9BACT|nr:hypothetical protein [Adhaeribacter radiodurans]QMU28052.1 hypothetical protein HUW48_08330 [Adhaeribacter radiodurans]
MKTKLYFLVIFLICAWQSFAQNPLVGTWQMQTDTDTLRSIKIITPTHWMLYTESVKEDSSKFIRSSGGTYTLNGDKYVENIQVGSWEDYGKVKTDFTYKVSGDKFYQKGTLILGDGTRIPIDEVWQKVKSEKSFAANPSIGTWNQLSSSYTMADGTKDSHTNATATRFQVITPTHWIRISHRDKKFENAMMGTYTMQGNKMYPKFEYASFPINKIDKAEIIQRVENNKLYWEGTIKDATGKTISTFSDVFEKVTGKTNKAVATK